MKHLLPILALLLLGASPSRDYPAHVTAVHDGDTLTVDVKLGFNIVVTQQEVRLSGLDSPELATPAGKVSRDYLTKLISGQDVTLVLSIDPRGNPRREKYGRLLGVLLLGGSNVNELLIKEKYARPYDGGKKLLWGPSDEVPGP